MPNYSDAPLDRIFHALADGTRRAILERLTRGPASVSDLAAPFSMSLPAIVQHLGVLEEAGIVSSQKVGRVRTCQLAPDGLVGANEWIVERRTPATKRLDRLGDYLSQQTPTKENPT